MALPFLHELETQALTLIKKIAEESEPVTMTQAEIICDHYNLVWSAIGSAPMN